MRIQGTFRFIISPLTILAGIITCLVLIFTAMVVSNYIKSLNQKAQIAALQRQKISFEEKQKNTLAYVHDIGLEDKRLSGLFASLIKSSNVSKTSLGEITLNEEKILEEYNCIPLIISVSGNYNQICRFINELERDDIRFLFRGIEMSTKETKASGIRARLSGEFALP